MCKGLGGASRESGWASSCILDWLLKGINSPPADAVNVVDVGSRQKLGLDREESIYLIEFLSGLREHIWTERELLQREFIFCSPNSSHKRVQPSTYGKIRMTNACFEFIEIFADFKDINEQIFDVASPDYLQHQNCLRRRDAGLLNQLQELDKQISDLRLDVEKTADEHLDMDSRPSSGFYELSDGTSGSLSNSSNSVFSECLSSCHSSTCFCSSLDASLSGSDGRPKSADFISWLEQNKGTQQNDQVGMASPSTPHTDSFDIVADVHPKYQCDLVSKNGNDVYRYPSPLHAVAVQSPMFLLPVTSCPPREEVERTSDNAAEVGLEVNSEKTVDSCLSHTSHSPSCPLPSRKMDGYILSLVQKKAPSVRTNKPRTNLNADLTKGILRHGSLCLRQMASAAPSNTTNTKNLNQPLPHSSGGTLTLDNSAFSPIKQNSKEVEHMELKKIPAPAVFPPNANSDPSKPSVKNVKTQEAVRSPVTKGDAPKESGQPFLICPKESPGQHVTP
ncbi:hypothetical protein E2320_021789 [Naja naja]|nr:hypothetical protein E2320_021789 [Naja naja]